MKKFFKIRVAHTDTGEVREFVYYGVNPKRRIEKYRHIDGRTDYEADLYAIVDILFEYTLEQYEQHLLIEASRTSSYYTLAQIYRTLDYIQMIQRGYIK